jgi:hypothetical protein
LSVKKAYIRSVAQDLDILPQEWSAYRDKETGEVVSVCTEAFGHCENGGDDETYIDGPVEDLVIARGSP